MILMDEKMAARATPSMKEMYSSGGSGNREDTA
jgi:hypothetical protein